MTNKHRVWYNTLVPEVRIIKYSDFRDFCLPERWFTINDPHINFDPVAMILLALTGLFKVVTMIQFQAVLKNIRIDAEGASVVSFDMDCSQLPSVVGLTAKTNKLLVITLEDDPQDNV